MSKILRMALCNESNINLEGLNIVKNIENFNYKLDEWKRGNIRVLFIVGLSGSGKTTFTRKIAEESGAKMVSLDGYLKKLLRSKYGQFDSDEYHRLVHEHGLELILKDNPKDQIIFEGAQTCWMKLEDLKEYAIIIIGASFLQSTWRAILRDFTKDHWDEYGHIAPHVHTSWNLNLFRPISNMLDSLKEEVTDN